MSDDASCEKVRLSLEDCDVEKDITNFIKDQGTGQEIPDPPKFINFCRGDTDTASQTSEDENYSVAQFARTMNPSYRASSPQPSMFESHHDPNNPLARELLGKDTRPIPQDEINVTPRQPEPAQSVQSARGIQPDPRLVQAQQQAHQQYQQNQVPHNDYPADGMTQFCRIGPPSERSTIPSPVRPSSRDSQSDYSNPTSFSSIEPPSGSASPGKPMAMSPQPQAPEEPSIQKKKGFFQNSPFSRRKSRQEKEAPVLNPPTSRNTWGPTSQHSNNENVSPTRPLGRGARGTILTDPQSASPEPVDPRANFQLNIGNNVFDVASPDGRREAKTKDASLEDLDPIAQALAELKGVTKQTSVRVSADRYHGLATPMPPGTPAIPGGAPPPLANVNLNAAKRGTPPPSYDQPPMSRLGAPQPAHTARQMQKTTQMYIDQKANVFNTGSTNRAQSRPGARSAGGQEPPRAVSPAPRATSPRPGMYTGQQQPQSPASYRAVSPNPYAASNAGGRPRAQTAGQGQNPYGTPTGRGSYSSARDGSPNVQRAVSPQPGYTNTRPNSRAAPTSRAVSPQPQFRQSYDRPSSSRGSDMALQIAPGPGSDYGGSQRGRSGGQQQQRPQSSYYGGSGSDMGHNSGGGQVSSRVRSKSVAEPRQYTRDGRMILHYCEFVTTLMTRNERE